MVRRRPEPEYGKHTPDYAQASKRRRGGEVGLSNILENIVETLRGRKEISYLFLKPVTKKEAPDYLDIISHPMDLSTIRDKARRMEYRAVMISGMMCIRSCSMPINIMTVVIQVFLLLRINFLSSVTSC
ncbi:UNVERIFIED_CONTAM: Transcription initiation factor TFIID subunit [Sesamum latifolium]|uniref:Transcription initiation factor TFIID subunit n=1 Tax=Sesamum latifolium TaxID=2727402 RepID=A0AAW2V0D2_9LAMI